MKNIGFFIWKFSFFLVVKFSVYLNRRVFVMQLKTPYTSKTDFFIQESFNKLIYRTDTIIKCGIWQPIKFQLVNLIKNEMIFFLSYFWIKFRETIKKKNIPCLIQFKNERLTKILQLLCATFCDCFNTIYQFIKPFLVNKMSIFEDMAPLIVYCNRFYPILNIFYQVWRYYYLL